MNINKKKEELAKAQAKKKAIAEKEAQLLKEIKMEEEKKAKTVKDALGKEMIKIYPELINIDLQQIDEFVRNNIKVDFNEKEKNEEKVESIENQEIDNLSIQSNIDE